MIIPAIDLIQNSVVRLSEGKYDQLTKYSQTPVDAAKFFEDKGCVRLHLVDLEGAKEGNPKHMNMLEQIASQTNLEIDFSGGLRTMQDIQDAHNAGAKYVSIGSMAVKQEEIVLSWLDQFVSDFFILSADVKDGNIAISGWLEDSKIELIPFIKKWSKVLNQVICTDISKDGLLQGPNIELYQQLHEEFPNMQIIASGGVSKTADIEKCMEVGCSGVIVGKALYEGKVNL